MENNMFSGIFRGLKIKNPEKSRFSTNLVEAAGVLARQNVQSFPHGLCAKNAKKRHFSVFLFTRAQAEFFRFKIFRGFFGDFPIICHPSLERGCNK